MKWTTNNTFFTEGPKLMWKCGIVVKNSVVSNFDTVQHQNLKVYKKSLFIKSFKTMHILLLKNAIKYRYLRYKN